MKKIAIAVLLSATFAAPAIAAGPYIGLNVGQNKIDFSGVKASTVYSVFGGYSFNEYIAAELAYVDFGSADVDGGGSVKGNVYSLSAVGSLPLGSDFSLFGKVGYASARAEATTIPSQTKDDVTYGVGGQYNATRNVGLRLGYDIYRVKVGTETKDSALWNIGALYRF